MLTVSSELPASILLIVAVLSYTKTHYSINPFHRKFLRYRPIAMTSRAQCTSRFICSSLPFTARCYAERGHTKRWRDDGTDDGQGNYTCRGLLIWAVERNRRRVVNDDFMRLNQIFLPLLWSFLLWISEKCNHTESILVSHFHDPNKYYYLPRRLWRRPVATSFGYTGRPADRGYATVGCPSVCLWRSGMLTTQVGILRK